MSFQSQRLNHVRRRLSLWLAAWFVSLSPVQGESGYRLLGPADFDGLAVRVELEPGDFLLFPDGTWENVTLRFRGRGTREKPITLRPLNAGKFALRGRSTLIVDGEWLVVEGLQLQNEAGAESVVILKGRNNRLTSNRIDGPASRGAIQIVGSGHRVDRCLFSEAQSLDSLVVVESANDGAVKPIFEENRFGGARP